MPEREAVRLWCCTSCGKWSHAQRKPSSHQRVIRDGGPAEHNGYEHTPARRVALASGYKAEDILEEEEGFWADEVRTNEHGDGEPDETWHPGHVVVRCGPFEAWTATRDGESDGG